MSKLFYVIGASGAGKDTLMNYARNHINGFERVIFAHRYITRPPFTGNENHVHLTVEEFLLRMNAGLFALSWESHGQHYGIGLEINMWMEKDFNVIVNGSRQYLPIAQQLYPDMKVILIDANPEIIIERLTSRGRENALDIEKRMARTAEIDADLKNCIKIQNNGSVDEAGKKLLNMISITQKMYM